MAAAGALSRNLEQLANTRVDGARLAGVQATAWHQRRLIRVTVPA